MMVRVITPAGVFFEGEAILAEFAGGGGKMGVFARHSPLTVPVEPGALAIHGDREKRDAILGEGFAQILPDRLTILVQEAEWN